MNLPSDDVPACCIRLELGMHSDISFVSASTKEKFWHKSSVSDLTNILNKK